MGVITCHKTLWFSGFDFYSLYIYEDLFIRRYVSSFLVRLFATPIVLGSIVIRRTFGKIYLNLLFFCIFKKVRVTVKHRRILNLTPQTFKKRYLLMHLKPFRKCKQHLLGVLFLYTLEFLLGTQVFIKFSNIYTIAKLKVSSWFDRFVMQLQNKLFLFKTQLPAGVWIETLYFLTHLFKFKNPDSLLLSNFIATYLLKVKNHIRFLLFLKKALRVIRRVFVFKGLKVLISGKLNNKRRARTYHIQIGQVTRGSFNTPLISTFSEAFTMLGSIGVKVHFCNI